MSTDSIDLNAFDTRAGAEAGIELTLVHPKTGEPLTFAKIRILGADSDAYRDLQMQMQRRAAERMARTRKLNISPEELEAQALDLLVAVTQGWSGLTLDGAPFEYSPENARKLYTRATWIREQVDTAVQDRGNFLPRSGGG